MPCNYAFFCNSLSSVAQEPKRWHPITIEAHRWLAMSVMLYFSNLVVISPGHVIISSMKRQKRFKNTASMCNFIVNPVLQMSHGLWQPNVWRGIFRHTHMHIHTHTLLGTHSDAWVKDALYEQGWQHINSVAWLLHCGTTNKTRLMWITLENRGDHYAASPRQHMINTTAAVRLYINNTSAQVL